MDGQEKTLFLSAILAEDIPKDDLARCISIAQEIILTRMYPFGYDTKTCVPAKYERTQIQIAAEIYAKRGAEGQTSHSENGIIRQWSSSDISPELLKRIIPHCGGLP